MSKLGNEFIRLAETRSVDHALEVSELRDRVRELEGEKGALLGACVVVGDHIDYLEGRYGKTGLTTALASVVRAAIERAT